jgi:hypothetical protein
MLPLPIKTTRICDEYSYHPDIRSQTHVNLIADITKIVIIQNQITVSIERH